MLKIQRSANGRVVLKLSGRIEAEDVKELQEVLAAETAAQRMVFGLKDMMLINQDGIEFLAHCDADRITLGNCPLYIRE
jgi:hypothetical protein